MALAEPQKEETRVQFAHRYAADPFTVLKEISERDAKKIPQAYRNAGEDVADIITWTPGTPGSIDFRMLRPYETECIERNRRLITPEMILYVCKRLHQSYELENNPIEQNRTGTNAVEEYYAKKLIALVPELLEERHFDSFKQICDDYKNSSWPEAVKARESAVRILNAIGAVRPDLDDRPKALVVDRGPSMKRLPLVLG